MSKLNDVLLAIDDFRTELFSIQNSAAAALTPAAARIGLRGMLGKVVSPLENIHATGVGIRRKAGKLRRLEFVIKVYVFHKVTGLGKLLPNILLKPFHGVDLDIEELPVMQIRAKKKAAVKATASATTSAHHQAHHRPVPGGVEIQPLGASFVGTLGGFVRPVSDQSGTVFLLSNNHVLANTNRLPTGTEIVQPLSSNASDVFALLTSFEPIHLASPTNPFPSRNRLDAAIARVTDQSLIQTASMFGIPNYTPSLKAAVPGMEVTKSGRTTGVTDGLVSAIRVDGVRVNYGTSAAPLIGTFDGCIQIDGNGTSFFSKSGDSGSFILEKSTGRPVALLFAGQGMTTTACDLTAVCTRFSVIPV